MFDAKRFLDYLIRLKNNQGELRISLSKNENIFLDFDDIVPFFMFLGKENEIKTQIEISRKYTYHGFIPFLNFLYAWRIDEYLGGVLCYYENTKDVSVLDLIYEQEIYLNQLFNLNYIPAYININTDNKSRLSFARGYGIIEVCLENDIFSIETKEKALQVLDNFIFNNKFFQNTSLFLNKYLYLRKKFVGKYIPLPSKFKFIGSSSTYFTKLKKDNLKTRLLQLIPISYGTLMKDNSNLIFSIIEAYKFTHNQKYKILLKKWIFEGVLKNLFNINGFIYTSYRNNLLNEVSLAQNFTFIDILNDYYHYIEKDNYLLEISKNIADFWLLKKWENGLIPENFYENFAFLDCQTDFSISLKKLFYLTSDKKYDLAGKSLYNSIINNFYKKNYFMLKIDDKSKIIDNSFNLKYNALFLKAHIAYNFDLNIFDPIFKDR